MEKITKLEHIKELLELNNKTSIDANEVDSLLIVGTTIIVVNMKMKGVK